MTGRKRLAATLAIAFAIACAAAEESPEGFPAALNPDAEFLARISGLFVAEDPTSVYGFDINDAQVEFVLDGTWNADLDSALAINFAGDSPALSFTPPVFTQTVDLSSWVFIDKTWYFESSFAEEFTKNSVAAGYVGGDDSPVKHVRLGNAGISFPTTYPFIAVGGGKAIAPGVMGTFGGTNWKADAIVRYDTATSRELILSGMNEVTDSYVSVTALPDGKWFVLPDAPVTGAVSVYVEDDAGNVVETAGRTRGRHWRKLNAAEFSVSGVDGIVSLAEVTTGSVAVVYNGSYATASGAAGPGLSSFVAETWYFFKAIADKLGVALPSGYLPDPASSTYADDLAKRFTVTLDGSTALVVRERGYFSPFAVESRYKATSSDPVVMYAESGVSPDWLAAESYDSDWVEIYRTDYPSSASGIPGARTPEARFPLASELPKLYMPAHGGRKSDTDLAIRARTYKEISTISLGTDAIAGTIVVTRNGIEDTAFTFDDSTGLLTLQKMPSSSETIHITWLDSDASARNAALALALGVAWNPVPELTLTAASAFRWNVSKAGYTDSGATSPGSFIVSSGVAWEKDGLRAATSFAFEASIADTTGYYRVLGMDDTPVTYYPDSDWYVAAAGGIEPVIEGKTLSGANRVTLAGASGTSLPTVTDSAVSGSALSLSCSLPDGASWAAADILAGSTGGAAFTSAGTVAIALKNSGSGADFDVYLQLGTGTSDYYEDPDTVRTWKIETPKAGAGWVVRTVTLSDDDRSAISAGSDMRLVLVPSATASPTAANPVPVRLYSGPIEITGTKCAGTAEPDFGQGSSGITGAISLLETADPAPTTLAAAFPAIVQRFNAGEVNTVLVARFTPDRDGQTVTIARNIEELPLASYRYLSFFMDPLNLPAGEGGFGNRVALTLTVPDDSPESEKTALEVSLPTECLAAGKWQEVTIDLDAKTVSVDGTALPASAASVSIPDRNLKPTRVALSFDDWPPAKAGSSGYAYEALVDEMYLSSASSRYSVQNKTEVAWKKDGAVLSAGNTAIVSDPSVSVEILSEKTVSTDDAPVVSLAAKGGVSILKATIDGSVSASSTSDEIIDTATHSVTIPLGPLTVAEKFAVDFSGSTYSRADSLSLAGPLSAGIATSVKKTTRKLERDATFRLAPAFPLTPIGLFTATATSTFAQSGTAPVVDIGGNGWTDVWADTLRYSLSTGEADAAKRTGKTVLTLGWAAPTDSGGGFRLKGATLEATGESAYVASTSTSLGAVIDATLSFPIGIGETVLVPSWTRTAKQSKVSPAGGSYASDTSFLGYSLAGQAWFFATPPIADLFDESIPSAMRTGEACSRVFSNHYAIDWTRPSLGLLSDLWIPSSAEASIKRETTTDATASNVGDGYTASVKAGFTALNVAGSYGVLKLFGWYEQDEISQLYGWSPKWGNGYFTWSLDTWHSVMLFFGNSGSVSAENAFHYDSPDIAGANELTRDAVKLVWKRPGKDSLASSIIVRFTDMPLATTREDSVSFTIARDEDSNDATFDVDHLLRTRIGKNGEIRLSCGIGVSADKDGLSKAELRLGMGGKLTF